MITPRHIYLAQQGVCFLCGLPLSPKTFTKDHFIPRSHALSSKVKYNLVLVHGKCNRKKANRLPSKLEISRFKELYTKILETY